jgi:Tol biopolymer transport system component
MKTTAKRAWWKRVFKPVLSTFVFGSVLSMANASVQLVSLSGPSSAPPAGGDGSSGLPIISADGRYVLFASTANNLVLTNNNNFVLPQRMNVFLRDRGGGVTTLVSANLAGTGGGNGDSIPTGISTNGQFALFESSASDLVANDTNNASDIFVRDLVNGITTLVSVGTNGAIANRASRGSVMTPDGRYVAFVSAASNLVSADTNTIADVFVRDLVAAATTLVSVGAATNANPPVSGAATSSESPEITPDGRYVAFYSTATNMVAGTTNTGEIYVRDLTAGKTIWASTNARAIFQARIGNPNVVSCNYSISDDGRFVAFETCTNPPSGSSARGIILRYGLQTGLTDIIHTNANEQLLSFELIHNLTMTPDGRFVAFVANLSGVSSAIYCWDAQTGTNTLVSASLDNSTPANGICDSPVVSSNGQFVAFTSTGTNLVANALAGSCHVYLRDRQGGVTRLLDADANGVGAGVDSTAVPALSADGGVVAFDCANLLPDNRHLVRDVVLRNVAAGTNDLISARHPAMPSQTPDGISGFSPSCVSTNGRFVAFYSDADNLVPNDTNGFRDVFVRDRIAGLNLLVSVNTNGNASGNGISSDPAISGDGRYVAFTSSADNLVTGDTNRAQDVFIRDLLAGTTALVSVNTDGVHSGNGDSFSPAISADGRYVLFHSKAPNLAAGSFGSGIENLFCRDLQTGTTCALTAASSGSGVYSAAMTPDGQSVAFIGTAPGISGTKLYVWNALSAARTYTNSATFSSSTFPVVAISPNGQKLAYLANSPLNLFAADLVANTVVTINSSGTFLSHAGLRFSNDGRFLTYAMAPTAAACQNVYLYDLQAGTNLLVSQNFSSLAAANTNSDSPSISPDGRFIAYRSFATNLVAMDSNNVADLFLYDAVSNATFLVSLNASGNSSAADRSLKPVFSGDSQTVCFQSWASDLSGNDYNNGSDIFALDLALPLPGSGGGTGGSGSGPYAQLIPAGAVGPNPVVSWPLAAGEAYQVQFKTNLTDAVWLNLPGNAAFIGLTGYISDSSPAPGQRFYRILLYP